MYLPKITTGIVLLGILSFVVFPATVYASEPTLADYWENRATFTYYKQIVQDNNKWWASFYGGSHVEVRGSTWYLFSRRIDWDNKPEYCRENLMYTEVRKSTDQGGSWSAPAQLLRNEIGTPSECSATDGDAWYNETEKRWHYIYQCQDRTGKWKGCHATRDGEDPYGTFVPDTQNPVVEPGELWSKICNSPADDCVALAQGSLVNDEGTFDIFDYQDGYYFVSFHGWDGVRGYRGVAKTTDFREWSLVASDSVLDLRDAQQFQTSWDQGGPIGFGSGRIVKENGYYYLISEAADKNLMCQPGQQWVWGMFRTDNAANTTWSQLPKGNPFFTQNDFPSPSPTSGYCSPGYVGLFKSGETTYLNAGAALHRGVDRILFYKLVWKPEAPVSPTNPKHACDYENKTVKFSWDSSTTQAEYSLRVDDLVNGWSGTCGNANQGDVCLSTQDNSYEIPMQEGHEYRWWLAACNAQGCSATVNLPKFGCNNETTFNVADFNKDGRVNLLDFNLLIAKFGNPYTLFDFNNLLTNWTE